MREASNGEDGSIGQFLVKELNSALCRSGIICRNVHQHDIGIGGLNAAHDRVGGGYGQTGAGVHGPGHAGSVHQHLKHGTLFIVGGDDDDRKFGHN